MKSILNWLDDRTGYQEILRAALYENIPGGSRWRYVWGSTLVFTFSMQVVTGLVLWMAYSPSSRTAWESVYYIQHVMQFGWLLRGLHHFTAQAMVVLLALHLMQVVIDGAYKAPREVNFWLGLILMQLVLAMSLTGYLLPWDQKGYWATQVATKISSIVPVVGPSIERLIVGGTNYGHHTLTRFFAMHAGVLPALLVGFLALHIYVFRRHGITANNVQQKPDNTFWPDQVLKDAVACLAVLAVVLLLVFRHAPLSPDEWTELARQNRTGEVLGAHLGAPADPADTFDAARPEWYFLFLFQFLKVFPGELEFLGAIVIPGGVLLLMFLMPFIGRWKLGHGFNVCFLAVLLIGIGWLTYAAIEEDREDANHVRAVADADAKAERVIELIKGPSGIDVQGAREVLRNDAKTHGPDLFAENCAQCHRFAGHDGTGGIPDSQTTASDLGTFGTREWIRGFITNPAGPNYFGPTLHATFNGEPVGTRFTEGEMAGWAAENVAGMTKEELDGVVELLLAQGKRTDVDKPDLQRVELGRRFFEEGSDNASACANCHAVSLDGDLSGEPGGGYPDLTAYASEEWLRDFLSDPGSERHYEDRNAMPAFKERLSESDLNILVRWLRRDWYEPSSAVNE
jgi:ubiquinol-cytochrome c reductase cytochrome b subunit